MTPIQNFRKRILAQFARRNAPERWAAAGLPPRSVWPPQRLEVGTLQDVVYLDAYDAVTGFGAVDEWADPLVARYNVRGAPVAETVHILSGLTALTSADGQLLGFREGKPGEVLYIDHYGDHVGTAIKVDDGVVAYRDMVENSLGVAIVESKRVLQFDRHGNYRGRIVCHEARGVWLALHDAWEMFHLDSDLQRAS